MKKNKLDKKSLACDSVESDTIHVGIELELITKGSGERTHDDDSCRDSAEDSYRDSLENASLHYLLNEFCGISISREASSYLGPYINTSDIIDREVESYMDCWSCDDDDCSHWSNLDESCDRDSIAESLKELTGNASFKVVSDGSINHDSDESDAEVCWNYYISRETVKDNAKILEHLKSLEMRFNKSCGLHINLNNYLNIPRTTIPTSSLSFLFNFVADSRKDSSYCNRTGMSGSEKYSMLFNQGDRVEFRFFSPTLESNKLNHYVVLAHTVYKRLAGIDCKLPKKSERYFIEKMVSVNNRPEWLARQSIDLLNSIKKASDYKNVSTEEVESDESVA